MHHGQSGGKPKKVKRTNIRKQFTNFAEIGGICNMHHWIGGMDALPAPAMAKEKWLTRFIESRQIILRQYCADGLQEDEEASHLDCT